MRWTEEFRLQCRFRVVCLVEGLQSHETDSRPKGLAVHDSLSNKVSPEQRKEFVKGKVKTSL